MIKKNHKEIITEDLAKTITKQEALFKLIKISNERWSPRNIFLIIKSIIEYGWRSENTTLIILWTVFYSFLLSIIASIMGWSIGWWSIVFFGHSMGYQTWFLIDTHKTFVTKKEKEKGSPLGKTEKMELFWTDVFDLIGFIFLGCLGTLMLFGLFGIG